MKTKKMFFPFLLILITIGIGACEEKESDSVSINQIEKNSSYLELSFTNTKWKLIGFVNVKHETIKMAKPESDSCYVLTFYSDNTFHGITSTNHVEGRYEMNLKTGILKIKQLGGTEINELYNGKYYIESLYLIDSFQITDRGLELYYENKKYYLLFQPLTTPTLPQGLHPVATTNIKQSTLVLKSSALLSGLLSTPDPHPVRCVPL